MSKEASPRGTVSCQQTIRQEFQITIPCFKNNSPHNKAFDYVLKTFDSYSKLQSPAASTSRKSSRFSVIPLNKQKIRVNIRARNRYDSKCGFDIFKSTNSSPSKGGYESSTHKTVTEFFTMLSFMYNKSQRKSYKLEVLIDELLIYSKSRKERELTRQIYNINSISQVIRTFLINNKPGQFKYNTIKYCQGELSKLFFDICYEIYLFKNNKQDYNMLDNIHKDIEYYSRRLKMLNLTISCCMDMGKINCDYFQFGKACIEYSKAVRLAVFLGDKYMEELAIDRLGMCQYYRGDIISANHYHNSLDRLSSYDKSKIKQTYSNEYQIQKILQQKTKERSEEDYIRQQFFNSKNKQNTQFNFDGRAKDTQYIQNNYSSFRKQLKEMIKIKELKKKLPLIKYVMSKSGKIGDKKYSGKVYFVPKASKFINKSYEESSQQFLISHKSYNRNNVGLQTFRLDKHCKIIDQILNFIFSQFKTNAFLAIKQERQSLYQQEAK